MAKVVKFENSDDKHLRQLKETIEHFQKRYDEGEFDEVVISTCNSDGDVELYVAARDFLGAVGMLTVAQDILLDTRKG